jgi:hypothetical protein
MIIFAATTRPSQVADIWEGLQMLQLDLVMLQSWLEKPLRRLGSCLPISETTPVVTYVPQGKTRMRMANLALGEAPEVEGRNASC